MSGMSGGSMLRTRRKDANVKPNRRLDRKSSRGMIYENEELRLRTININAEVERGQTDIKKLKRENEQLRREVGALRGEYDKLERLLRSRHQGSNDYNSDPEASDSCCSGCESECCNIQNDVNAACDTPGTPQQKVGEGCCGGAGRGGLSAVPEETGARTPPKNSKVYQSCSSCQQQSPPSTTRSTPCELKPDNYGFSTMESPNQEYFKAVVTVPLSSHLPETPCICLTPSAIFPKTGLDVLINNNNSFENFEGLSIAPPIGFIIPPFQTSDEESYQIVPNVEMDSVVERIDAMTSSDDVSSANTVKCLAPMSNELVPLPKNSKQFPNGGNVEDLLGDIESVTSSSPEYMKDSYFVCKTKKVVQQLTTVQNTTNISNLNTGNACGCNCKCKASNTAENRSPPDVVIIDSHVENLGPQFYRTEKNIELNYDYPKAFFESTHDDPQPIIEESAEAVEGGVIKSIDLTQTTHTTTEVNSTVMLFERKKILKSKNKFPFFARSHSAPTETITDEPIYATVKKLPKKLRRLNIRNLENEIKYIPPSEIKEDPSKRLNDEQKVDLSESESTDMPSKVNGQLKIESLSESSERLDINGDANVIPNSPSTRKKKRFSIYFKRKSSNKNKLKLDTTCVDSVATQEECDKLLTVKMNTGDSDKLLDISSSLDSPDGLRFNDAAPAYTCKRHKKPKNYGTSRELKNHVSLCKCSCGGKVHHGEDCEDKVKFGVCSGGFCKMHHNKGCTSKREHAHHLKKGQSPSRHYFKHDSYQEITTSHSERERTNSLSSSGHSGFSLSATKHTPGTRREGSIPWCGCWGNSCI